MQDEFAPITRIPSHGSLHPDNGILDPPAQASPISYTFYGPTSAWESVALGEINDVAFSINLVGDTSAIQGPLVNGAGVYTNAVISATITLTGAAIQTLFATPSVTGTFLDTLEMYADNTFKEVGFTGPGGAPTFAIYTTPGTELDNYGLFYLNSILGVLIPGDVSAFNTSIGDLTLNAAGAPDAIDITFAAPVPIPAAVWLLASGLIGLVGLRRRMRK